MKPQSSASVRLAGAGVHLDRYDVVFLIFFRVSCDVGDPHHHLRNYQDVGCARGGQAAGKAEDGGNIGG